MAKTLEKTRKQIAKKRHGKIEALHEKSRDSKRLHRAQVRDDRLEKLAEARRKKDQPIRSCPFFLFLSDIFLTAKVTRAAFFQEAVRQNDNKPLELEAIQAKINEYVSPTTLIDIVQVVTSSWDYVLIKIQVRPPI